VNVLSIAPGIVNAENGNLSGGDVGTFWNHTYSEKAASALQVSFDRCERDVPREGGVFVSFRAIRGMAPGAFEDVDSLLTYSTIGEDAFRRALDQSVKGKRVGDRELRVRHLKEREQLEGCQVLFIEAAQRAR
jgi:YfiR/HmsC-like